MRLRPFSDTSKYPHDIPTKSLSPYKTPVKSPEVHQFICISTEKHFPVLQMLLRPFTQLRDRPRGSVNLGPNRLGNQWLHQTRKVMAKYGESQTCKASRWASVCKMCKNEPCLVDQGFQTLTEMTSVPSHLARSALEVLLISAELSLQN